MSTISELRHLVLRRDELKRAVVKWMDDEAKAIRIRVNSEAPMWPDYVHAEKALADAVNGLANTAFRHPDVKEETSA